MPFVNSFFEKRVETLFELAAQLETALSSAGIEYRIVGGLATYLYVEEVAPDAGRLTRDIDITVRRQDLERIAQAVEPFGLAYRHVAGLDMILDAHQLSASKGVHLIFAGEKVRPQYPEAAPELESYRTIRGLRLIPLSHLVRMKLTSFRAKDEAHLKDLDDARLISAEVEASLSPILRGRLAQMRARE